MSETEVTMLVTVKDYLSTMKAIERGKPESLRRHIPSVKELASISGVSLRQYTDLINNQTANINRVALGKTVAYLESLGFEVTPADLIRFVRTSS